MTQLSDIIPNLKLPGKAAIKSVVDIEDVTKTAFNPDLSQAPVTPVDTNQPAVDLASIQATIDAITKQAAGLTTSVFEKTRPPTGTQAFVSSFRQQFPETVEAESTKTQQKAINDLINQGISEEEAKRIITGETPVESSIRPVEPVKTTILDKVLGRDPAREQAERELAQIRQERAEVEKVPTTQEALTEAAGFFGIDPESFKQLNVLSTQIGTIVAQIAAVDTREQQALLNKEVQLQGRPGVILTGEQNLIKKQFAIEKSGLAAQATALATQAQLIQGNYENVKDLANRYIVNATYQRQQTIDELNWASDIYEDVIDDLDEAEKNDWEDLKEQYEKEQEADVKEKEDVRDLMLDNPTAGINLTDTLDEATEKAVVAGPIGTDFTPTQKLALEQAGLANAPRNQQLDYLERQGFLRGAGGQPQAPETLVFSRDEINTGAAKMNVSLNDFNQFSPAAKNKVINNWADVEDEQDFIEESIEDGAFTSEQLEAMIAGGTNPPELKDHLTKFIKSITIIQ